jgi:exopolysaccharide biosynthesis polyprenyl glycosylphosphotransferase
MESVFPKIQSAEPLPAPPPAAPPVEQHPPRPKPRLQRIFLSLSPASWVCFDFLVIGLATCVAQVLLTTSMTGYGWLADPWLASVCFCGSLTTAGLVFGLYDSNTLLVRRAIVLRTGLTLAFGVILALASVSLFFYAQSSRWMGLWVSLAYLGISLPVRLFAHNVLTSSRVRVLLIGANESTRKLVDVLNRKRSRHYEVIGHLKALAGPQRLVAATHSIRPRFRSDRELQFEDACPCVGGIHNVAEVLATDRVDEVIVAADQAVDPGVGRAVATCLEHRCRVTDQATFVEKLLGEVPAEYINAEWFLRADVQNHGGYDVVKRVVDILVASFGLLLTGPIMPLIALVIRLESRGAAIYRQTRVGQHGRHFTIYKFRTMCSDAEKNGAQWAAQNDNRVTRLGRFLRKSRLDELPQLFNIIRGEMSLVGPRPERPEFVQNLEQLLPHYRLRHLAKPGLSGWAQIHYGYGSSIEDTHRKLCYDLYYLKHRSLDLDVAIIIRTLGIFFHGAR